MQLFLLQSAFQKRRQDGDSVLGVLITNAIWKNVLPNLYPEMDVVQVYAAFNKYIKKTKGKYETKNATEGSIYLQKDEFSNDQEELSSRTSELVVDKPNHFNDFTQVSLLSEETMHMLLVEYGFHEVEINIFLDKIFELSDREISEKYNISIINIDRLFNRLYRYLREDVFSRDEAEELEKISRKSLLSPIHEQSLHSKISLETITAILSTYDAVRGYTELSSFLHRIGLFKPEETYDLFPRNQKLTATQYSTAVKKVVNMIVEFMRAQAPGLQASKSLRDLVVEVEIETHARGLSDNREEKEPYLADMIERVYVMAEADQERLDILLTKINIDESLREVLHKAFDFYEKKGEFDLSMITKDVKKQRALRKSISYIYGLIISGKQPSFLQSIMDFDALLKDYPFVLNLIPRKDARKNLSLYIQALREKRPITKDITGIQVHDYSQLYLKTVSALEKFDENPTLKKARIIDGFSLEDISINIGCSRERVRQIEEDSRTNAKESMRAIGRYLVDGLNLPIISEVSLNLFYEYSEKILNSAIEKQKFSLNDISQLGSEANKITQNILNRKLKKKKPLFIREIIQELSLYNPKVAQMVWSLLLDNSLNTETTDEV